jgi:hypothetical protein
MRGSDHSIVNGRISLRSADSAVNYLEGRPRLYWAYRLECIGSKARFLLSKFEKPRLFGSPWDDHLSEERTEMTTKH